MSTAPVCTVLLLLLPPTAARGPLDGTLYERGRPTSTVPRASVAAMMLAISGFLLSVVYLVHCRSEEIRWLTWRLLSSTLSIFVAVLINTVMVHCARLWVVPVLGVGFTAVVSLLLVFLVAHALMYWERQNRLGCKARAVIVGHLGGFTTIHIFGRIQERTPFSNNVALSALVLPSYAAVWMVGALSSSHVRSRLQSTTTDKEETVETLEDECVDFENDVATLCLGFLISQTFRFAICGSLPPLSGEAVEHSAAQDWALLLCAVMLMAVVCASAVWLHKETMSPCRRRFASITQGTVAMAASWCFLFWGQWYLEETLQMDKLLGKAALAILTSVVSMSLISVLSFLVRRATKMQKGLREVIEAFGLLIGFAWEACFDNVIDDVRPQKAIKFIALALIFIVLPGWRLYVLTRATRAWQLEDHANPPSMLSLCTDKQEEELQDCTTRKVVELCESSTSDSE